jgi:hypothetical protein
VPIDVHAVSPENEMPIARRLEGMVRAAWPSVAASEEDRVDILVGVRTPADIDLLVIVDLTTPQVLPPQRRRQGGNSVAAEVGSAIIAIEVKQLDVDRFSQIGNQLYPAYAGEAGRRSVAQQARDAAYSVVEFARRSGTHPFVHSLAWLTEVEDETLQPIEPMVLGKTAAWFAMLDAAMQQHTIPPIASRDMVQAVQAVRRRLLTRRKESARDVARIESLSRDLAGRAVVDALLERAGTAQIRLQGRGGSGKTTSLALLAVRLAEAGERILILTFHRTLQSDIAHLVDGLLRPTGVPHSRILVETAKSFFLSALSALGADIPKREDGTVDYAALDSVLAETKAMLIGGPDEADGDVARLRQDDPDRFAWDHILIDEAQDWSDAERDFIRALYGHRRLVLGDGQEQLIQRQQSCDWNAGVPRAEQVVHRMGESLRMLRNVATFANCCARAMGFSTWNIAPREELPGGQILIVTGNVETPAFARALVAAAAVNKADPVDCLVCVPPSAVERDEHGRKRARFAKAADDAGLAVWDATDPTVRGTPPEGTNAIRIVQYDSCRGLEGWITVALDLDELYLQRTKYPNLSAADPPVDPAIVAKRWLMIPLTRAVHTLIITVRDPNSVVAGLLRTACEDPALPRGVVNWVTSTECIERLAAAFPKVTI